MKNLDILQAKKTEIMQKMNKAIVENDEEGFVQAFNEFSDNIQQAVMAEAEGMIQAADNTILAGRGVRQLTSAETKYYQSVIDAMKSGNPQQALSDITEVMPKTTIDAVFEDLKAEHPLLQYITFQNTSGLIEYLVNTNGKELAAWGTLTSTIVKELTSGFKKVNMTLHKLSAFLPVAKSMLDLGPAWLDRYTRSILGEAAAYGLENGIAVGTGKDMPIGMNRQVGTGVTVTDGVYPVKTAIAITSLDAVTYGDLLSRIAVDPNGKTRVIDKVILLCNPVDYLKRIMPATTIRGADGTFVNNVFPYPTQPIQCTEVPEGKAILGLAKKYFMAIGTAKEGKIEYSDEYKFLEDERVYLIKLFGHGEPLDNNAFLYLDISKLEPAAHQVFVTNTDGDPIPIYPIYDGRLSGLTIGSLTLSPVFNKSTFYYTASTSNATNVITATPKDSEATVAIKVGETTVANGAAATWANGPNTVTIEVTSGTETETYTVVVTKTA